MFTTMGFEHLKNKNEKNFWKIQGYLFKLYIINIKIVVPNKTNKLNIVYFLNYFGTLFNNS